jgi:predicted Co/Zn/Cd cation transporter (cation efflux family)
MKQLYYKYWGNFVVRTITSTRASFSINTITGAVNLLIGIYIGSIWFITNAVYYLLLSIMRGLSLKEYFKADKKQDTKERYNIEDCVFRRNGYLLCLLSIAYFGVCILMYINGDKTVYQGHIVYLVALIAFSKLGFAINGAIVAKRLKSPILSSLKSISYADALVAIVITESTLLSMKGNIRVAEYSGITGMIFSTFILIAGISAVNKKKK